MSQVKLEGFARIDPLNQDEGLDGTLDCSGTFSLVSQDDLLAFPEPLDVDGGNFTWRGNLSFKDEGLISLRGKLLLSVMFPTKSEREEEEDLEVCFTKDGFGYKISGDCGLSGSVIEQNQHAYSFSLIRSVSNFADLLAAPPLSELLPLSPKSCDSFEEPLGFKRSRPESDAFDSLDTFITNFLENEADDCSTPDLIELAHKFRRAEHNKMMALCAAASNKNEQTKLMLPKPVNIKVTPTSVELGEVPQVTITWEIRWNKKFPVLPSAEVVLSIIGVGKCLDLSSVDPVSLILPPRPDSTKKRLDKVFEVFATQNNDDTWISDCYKTEKMSFSFQPMEDLGAGDYFVAVWARPRINLDCVGLKKEISRDMIQFVALQAPTSALESSLAFLTSISPDPHKPSPEYTKLVVRPVPVAPKLVCAMRAGENICILKWHFTMIHAGVSFEVRMEVFDEAEKTWKVFDNSCNFEKGLQGKDLAFPRLHVKTNITGTRRIAIPGIPKDAKIRFNVVSLDSPTITERLKNSIVIPGGKSVVVESNEVEIFDENDDMDRNTCTICYEPVSFEELKTKTITEVPLHELEDEPDRDPLCPSGPESCCHVFHAKCLHQWTNKHGKSTCPNCCRPFSQEVMFKRFEHILCVPINAPKPKYC